MGITDTSTKESYSGDGSTTDFDFDFKIYADSHLEVILVDSDGEEIDQTLTTDYTVDRNTGEGGTVSMGTAPASGETLLIRQDIPLTQPDTTGSQNAPSEVIERMSDRVTLLVQQVQEQINRAPIFKKSTTSSQPELPEPDENKFLAWDSVGDLKNVESDGGSAAVTTTITNGMSAKNISGFEFTPGLWVKVDYFVTRDSGAVLGSGIVNLHYDGSNWQVVEGPYWAKSGKAVSHGLTFSMSGNQLQVAADSSGTGSLLTRYYAA